MNASAIHRKIITGSVWTLPPRVLLHSAAWLYGHGVALRNRRFDRPDVPIKTGIPVISVGNITAGGTGKTPVVIDLANRLLEMGRRPVIISRGYKSVPGELGDEQRVVERHCPSVPCLADANRLRAAGVAQEKHAADAIVLDDGFQHRRMARSLDIVLIDATCPFGFGYLLPRGYLREPPTALARADVVVLTRCDQVPPDVRNVLEAHLQAWAPRAVHLQCTHKVTSVEHLDGTPLAQPLTGTQAVVFAGIGQPAAFAATVRSLGVEIVAEAWWPDHHRYTRADIEGLLTPDRFPPNVPLLTTEKDAVKLAAFEGLDVSRIGVVRIAIDFCGDGSRMLDRLLVEALEAWGSP